MKIIILAPANNVHTIKWLDYYEELGIETINVSLENHKDYTSHNWKNVRREYLELKFNGKLSYLFTARQLQSIINKEQPDLLHAHYVSSYGLIGSRVNFKPFVVSVWGSDIYDFPRRNLINRNVIRYVLKQADVICATSNALMNETLNYVQDKPLVITPFGVDTTRFSPKDHHNENRKTVTVGIVKGMEEKYGIEYLIKAFRYLKNQLTVEEFSNLHLKIVGDGPSLEYYKRLAKKYRLENTITFTGKVPHDQVPQVISDMDIFVVPSLIESFGVAAVEAQACGVPVIASDVGGLPEVVLDGKTGYIVPPKDPKAIAKKITQLMIDPALRKKMGEQGVQHIKQQYSWNQNAELMRTLYEDITSSKRSETS
ncbi:glycosyltransferase [Pseudalkalibacillus sp. Hm43]|uniref:glycosyltransferase n=1 Tax=Pseudalkalibacillus sp. Hm43 TaxID=3450742 RepID=UPI003F41F66B